MVGLCRTVRNQCSSFAMSFDSRLSLDSGLSLDSLLVNPLPDHWGILSLEPLPFRVTSIKHLYKVPSSPTFSPSHQHQLSYLPLRPRQYNKLLLPFVGEQQTVTTHGWSIAKPAGISDHEPPIDITEPPSRIQSFKTLWSANYLSQATAKIIKTLAEHGYVNEKLAKPLRTS